MNIQEYSKPKIPVKVSKEVNKHLSNPNYNPNRNEYALSKLLRNLGWQLLSLDGYFSDVYGNPNKDYILKINKRPDSAYNAYVALIKKSNNPHFSKISDLKVLNIKGQKYYIYLIEKLDVLYVLNIDGDDYYADLIRLFNDIIRYPNDNIFTSRYPTEILQYMQKNPKLLQAIKIISKYYYKSSGISLDLHGNNMMKRNDGTLVITDPFS